MAKMKIYVGNVASGKSSKAKEEIAKDSSLRRVERDCLREMLFGKLFTGKDRDEKLVTKVQDAVIRTLFENGYSPLISDTNLNPQTVTRLKNVAKEFNAAVEVDDSFLQVPIAELIKRDLARPNSVGEKVIRQFAAKYSNSPQTEKIVQDKSLPKAVMFDLDGTLCRMVGRGAFEWHKVGQDEVNEHVASVVKAYVNMDYEIIFLSGRDSVCRNETIQWLEKHLNLFYKEHFQLFMRPFKDSRRDSVVKEELFREHVLGKFFVDAVYDDRAQVIRECWTRLGLPVFRCGIIDEDEF